LIVATAEKFSPESPEFDQLRKAFAETMFQEEGIKKVLGMSDTVQNLLFPGVTREQAIKFAQNMSFLEGTGKTFGGSLAAAYRILNPIPELGKMNSHVAKVLAKVPGGQLAARLTIGKYYALMTKIGTNPKLTEFLARKIDEEPEVARMAYRQIMGLGRDVGGAVGAGIGAVSAGSQPQRRPVQRTTISPL
jgi:hypothetical protein